MLLSLVHALFLRDSVDWDGLAFLLRPADSLFRDLAHVLYPAIAQGAAQLATMVGGDGVLGGKVLSAIAGALGAVLVQRLARWRGASPPDAWLMALLYATTPFVFRQAVSLEVYSLSMLGLVGAVAVASDSQRGRARRDALVAATLLAAGAGFHVGVVLATPFLAWTLLRRAGRRAWGEVAGAFAAVLSIALVLLVIAGNPLEHLGRLGRTVRAFLEARPVGDFSTRVSEHAREVGEVALQEAPVMTCLAGIAALILLATGAKRLRGPLLLELPFLAAYLVFGVPVIGLLLPPVLALVLVLIEAAHALSRRRIGSRSWRGLLLAALVVQIVLAAPRAWREATVPDALREEAALLERALPPDALVVAGRSAQHLRYYTRVETIAVADVLHRARARSGGKGFDPVEAVEREIDGRGGSHRAWLTSDAARAIWETHLSLGGGHDPGTMAALSARLLEQESPVVVRGEPDLLLLYRASR